MLLSASLPSRVSSPPLSATGAQSAFETQGFRDYFSSECHWLFFGVPLRSFPCLLYLPGPRSFCCWVKDVVEQAVCWDLRRISWGPCKGGS